MGTVAKEVHDAGCEVIGVVPGNVDFMGYSGSKGAPVAMWCALDGLGRS